MFISPPFDHKQTVIGVMGFMVFFVEAVEKQ